VTVASCPYADIKNLVVLLGKPPAEGLRGGVVAFSLDRMVFVRTFWLRSAIPSRHPNAASYDQSSYEAENQNLHVTLLC
jgi:hypothetical protein